MLVSIALGKWSIIFFTVLPLILGGIPGLQARWFAPVLPGDAMYRSVAIQLTGKEN